MTIGLAVFVILAHGIALFWPRKPIAVPVDDEGRPILWHNKTESTKDVACVWWEEDTQAAPPAAMEPRSMPSFSHAVGPLSGQSGEGRRSAA